MKGTLVAIPMKDPSLAKSRLSAVLDDLQRQRLALSLFERTLRFFQSAFSEIDVAVITASDAIASHAHTARVHVLREADACGLNAAVSSAAAWAAEHRYERLIIVPADIPVLLREEVEQMLELSRCCDVAIADAYDGGTNMLVLSPPRQFLFQYGLDSAQRHEAVAHAAGLRATRCYLPFLARDLDTPADCLVLLQKLEWQRTHSSSQSPLFHGYPS